MAVFTQNETTDLIPISNFLRSLCYGTVKPIRKICRSFNKFLISTFRCWKTWKLNNIFVAMRLACATRNAIFTRAHDPASSLSTVQDGVQILKSRKCGAICPHYFASWSETGKRFCYFSDTIENKNLCQFWSVDRLVPALIDTATGFHSTGAVRERVSEWHE